MKAAKFFLFLILAVVFISGNSEMASYAMYGGLLRGSLASIGVFTVLVCGFNYLVFIAFKIISKLR